MEPGREGRTAPTATVRSPERGGHAGRVGEPGDVGRYPGAIRLPPRNNRTSYRSAIGRMVKPAVLPLILLVAAM